WMAPGRNSVMLGMGDGSVQYIAIDDKGEQGRPIILKALTGSASASFSKGTLDCGQFVYAMLPGGSIVSAAVSGITAGDINRDGLLDIRSAIGVSAGCNHGVALLADGTVWQLGFAIKENGIKAPTAPTQVSDVRNAVAVAAGRDFDAAVMADGSVRFWSPPLVARQVPGVANVKKVVAGIGHTIVVNADGTIAEIAIDASGVQRAIPIPGIEGAVDCVVAGKSLLVLTADGTVQQVMFNPKEYTVQKMDKLSSVTALSSGGSYALALLDNGTVAHIAIDESGAHLTDAKIDLQNVASVSGGPDTFLAVTVDGKGWGGSVKGRAVTTIPPTSIIAAREAGSGLATGRRQHAALMGDGSVRIVDINEKGEASARVWGDPQVDQKDGFAAVSLGTTQMALLKGDGTVWICPIAISEAGVHIADTATLLAGVRLAVAVTVGDAYAYALTADGTVWFWAAQ
ncbi:MAG: chromosome condensation regulator, partial [Firmicutes bacterium]|nr:chromosome condensation regulator [Bacillota bacterium]